MLSIDRQVKRLLQQDQRIRRLHFLIIALGLVIIGLTIMIAFGMTPAKAASSCMTYSEARRLWPKGHLYWSGPNRCWSNRRERWRRFEAPRALAQVAEPQILPAPTYNALPRPRPDDADDYCCWPNLADLLADETEITLRKSLTDKVKNEAIGSPQSVKGSAAGATAIPR